MALLIKEALCIKPLTGHQCEGRCQCNYTFKAYYLSLTLQPLLPSPTNNGSPRSHTMTHQILILVFFFVFISLVFSSPPFLFIWSGLISPAGRDSPRADGALLLLPPPAAKRRNKTLVNYSRANVTQSNMFKLWKRSLSCISLNGFLRDSSRQTSSRPNSFPEVMDLFFFFNFLFAVCIATLLFF